MEARVPIIERVLVSEFHYHLPEDLIAQEAAGRPGGVAAAAGGEFYGPVAGSAVSRLSGAAAAERPGGVQQYAGVSGAVIWAAGRAAGAAGEFEESGSAGVSAGAGRLRCC